MKYILSNGQITAKLSDIGGEILSVKNTLGTEYMWQSDPAYWHGRSFHIFPYVGRLTKGAYTLHGKTYHMNMHGLVPGAKLDAASEGAEKVCFTLKSNNQTRGAYPFEFVYRQSYHLDENHLVITYEVENHDTKTMHFGIGAHPAFYVPLEKGLRFADYYLEFDEDCTPIQIGMTDACFVNGNESPFKLERNRILRLAYELFDHDAVILKNTSKHVRLLADGGARAVALDFNGFEYLMLWSAPGKKAPFLCIEPVSSLSSRQDVVEDFAQQKTLLSLSATESYSCKVALAFE